MRQIAVACALTFAIVTLGAPARAEDVSDKADCEAGIAEIKAAIPKAANEPLQAKLKGHLRIAERELGEREYDECMDAVKDARRLPKS